MEGNMLAMVVSDAGTYAPSPSNFPYTYPGALKEKPESSAGSDSGASNREFKKVRVIISSNGTSFTITQKLTRVPYDIVSQTFNALPSQPKLLTWTERT